MGTDHMEEVNREQENKFVCFRCGEEVVESVVDGYFAYCKNCDEDLYIFEVEEEYR